VSEEDYDGEVYNLEVESDNTYTAHMVVVHNCLESLARGVPIIAHRKGPWAEYAPPWCLVPEALRVKVFADNAIHTGYGYTIDVEKAVDLAHAMLDNLDEYKARTKEYAQRVLAEKYTWEKAGERIWDIVSR
jgi:glycosyltransferase involved in cell wall biosynthesis